MGKLSNALKKETEALSRQLSADWIYAGSVAYAPVEQPNQLTLMKNRIAPQDRSLFDFSRGPATQALTGREFVTAYDVLEAQMTDAVTAFYDSVRISDALSGERDGLSKLAQTVLTRFERDKARSCQTTIAAIKQEYGRLMAKWPTPRQIIRAMNDLMASRCAALLKLIEDYSRQLNQAVVLSAYEAQGYTRYIFITSGANCEVCNGLSGHMFNIADSMPGENLPPIHPNCDCHVGILDADGKIVAVLSVASMIPFAGWAFTVGNTQPNWYDALLRIPQDAKDLYRNLELAQIQRFKDIKGPISFLDWLTYGYLSANTNRGQVMFNDPSLYNIGNWLSSGLFDTIKGTFDPKEPLSLQHWLDSFGTVTMAVTAYNLAKSNAAGSTQSMPASKKLTGLDDLDDSVDDAAKSTAEGAGKAGTATVDIRKFSEYIFKDGAAPGKDVVYKNLGYGANDSELLAKIYQEQGAAKYASGNYTLGKSDNFGQRINIEIELPGVGSAAGKTSYINSGWMIKPDGSISLNTPFSGFTK